MSTDSSNTLLSEHQVLRSRIAHLEKERDFIKSLYGDMPQTIHAISKGALLSTLLEEFKNKLEAQLPNAYCLFIVCDQSCLQWRVQYKDATNAALLNAQDSLKTVPQALITFAASPSCPTRFDDHLAQDVDWKPWADFIADKGFVDVSMSSISDGQGSIYLAVVFQPKNNRIENDLVTLALECYVSWLRAVFEREKADQLLLEDSHRDPTTGLLRRFSFENSFNIVLKDSRRHFLRAALLSLRILSSTKIQEKELAELAEVMRNTVRDNDLIAYFDEHELVMGIRIQHLEDAEIVAAKLFSSLRSPKFANNRLIQDGLSIGIAFYPEHSTLDGLYRAANAAANVLNRSSGFRLEFHGEYYKSSADFYSL